LDFYLPNIFFVYLIFNEEKSINAIGTDAADSVYSRLRIWAKNQDGKEALFAKGAGAALTGQVSMLF